MSLRDKINQNPAIPAIGVIVALIVCGYFVIGQFSSGGSTPGKWTSYYTIDDGKTWFPDSRKVFPVFQRDGKNAVQAFVYTCDNNTTSFVGYLLKTELIQMQGFAKTATYVKRPGDAKWIDSESMAAAREIATVKCPSGVTGKPEMIKP